LFGDLGLGYAVGFLRRDVTAGLGREKGRLSELFSTVLCMTVVQMIGTHTQGRSHRGGHGGRVPRAPYHVPPTSK